MNRVYVNIAERKKKITHLDEKKEEYRKKLDALIQQERNKASVYDVILA